MNRKLFACAAALALSCAGSTQTAQAGVWWNPYWNLDGYLAFNAGPYSTYAPTGYWWGNYSYYYGGYYYNPYIGSYWSYPGYGYYYGWNSWPYVYGFVDSVRYTWRGPYALNTYWNSWYWDPAKQDGRSVPMTGSGAVMDIVTADFGQGIAGLPSTFQQYFTQDGHDFEVHSQDVIGPFSTGSFSEMRYMTAPQLLAYYATLPGVDAATLNAFENSSLFQAMMALPVGTIFGETDAYFTFKVPEPGTLALIGLGGLMATRRRR